MEVSFELIEQFLDHDSNPVFQTESLYFYLTANNLFTITGFSGNDPELVGFNGNYDGYSMPIPRSASLGLRFKF